MPSEKKDALRQSADGECTDQKNLENCPQVSIWLDHLSSCSGVMLASLLAIVMTEGLNADQQNILGNFISSVGSLISYKASRAADEV